MPTSLSLLHPITRISESLLPVKNSTSDRRPDICETEALCVGGEVAYQGCESLESVKETSLQQSNQAGLRVGVVRQPKDRPGKKQMTLARSKGLRN